MEWNRCITWYLSVVDPGFPRGGGANSLEVGEVPTYNFAKISQNCMKLKEFGPGGHPSHPLISTTACVLHMRPYHTCTPCHACPPAMHAPLPCMPPWREFLTHTSENITLPQLHCRRLIFAERNEDLCF